MLHPPPNSPDIEAIAHDFSFRVLLQEGSLSDTDFINRVKSAFNCPDNKAKILLLETQLCGSVIVLTGSNEQCETLKKTLDSFGLTTKIEKNS